MQEQDFASLRNGGSSGIGACGGPRERKEGPAPKAISGGQ